MGCRQRRAQKRSEDVKSRQGICNHANLLTGKLYCTCCGAAYYRRDSKGRDGSKNSKWVCSGKIKNGAASCDSFAIYEDEIKPLLLDVFRETAPLAENMVEEYIKLYQQTVQSEDVSEKCDALRRVIETAEKKKQKLLMFNAMGELSDQDFLSMNRQCTKEIERTKRACRTGSTASLRCRLCPSD